MDICKAFNESTTNHADFSQTEDTALTAVPFQPNVILLHIGTNDLSTGRADYNGEISFFFPRYLILTAIRLYSTSRQFA